MRDDPEEILANLGFAGSAESSGLLSRIPRRFLLAPSKVAGNDLAGFIERCEEMQEINDTVLSGYIGLSGYRTDGHIPSGIVSKILEKISERNRDLKRARLSLTSSASGTSVATVKPSFFQAAYSVMAANAFRNAIVRPTAAAAAADENSILEPENRKTLDDRTTTPRNKKRTRRLVLGHTSLAVNSDEELVDDTTATTLAMANARPSRRSSRVGLASMEPSGLPRPSDAGCGSLSSKDGTTTPLPSPNEQLTADEQPPNVSNNKRSKMTRQFSLHREDSVEGQSAHATVAVVTTSLSLDAITKSGFTKESFELEELPTSVASDVQDDDWNTGTTGGKWRERAEGGGGVERTGSALSDSSGFLEYETVESTSRDLISSSADTSVEDPEPKVESLKPVSEEPAKLEAEREDRPERTESDTLSGDGDGSDDKEDDTVVVRASGAMSGDDAVVVHASRAMSGDDAVVVRASRAMSGDDAVVVRASRAMSGDGAVVVRASRAMSEDDTVVVRASCTTSGNDDAWPDEGSEKIARSRSEATLDFGRRPTGSSSSSPMVEDVEAKGRVAALARFWTMVGATSEGDLRSRRNDKKRLPAETKIIDAKGDPAAASARSKPTDRFRRSSCSVEMEERMRDMLTRYASELSALEMTSREICDRLSRRRPAEESERDELKKLEKLRQCVTDEAVRTTRLLRCSGDRWRRPATSEETHRAERERPEMSSTFEQMKQEIMREVKDVMRADQETFLSGIQAAHRGIEEIKELVAELMNAVKSMKLPD